VNSPNARLTLPAFYFSIGVPPVIEIFLVQATPADIRTTAGALLNSSNYYPFLSSECI
jgi:hypothetical protein